MGTESSISLSADSIVARSVGVSSAAATSRAAIENLDVLATGQTYSANDYFTSHTLRIDATDAREVMFTRAQGGVESLLLARRGPGPFQALYRTTSMGAAARWMAASMVRRAVAVAVSRAFMAVMMSARSVS